MLAEPAIAHTPARAPTAPIGVFLLDDHEVVRRGVADMIDACDDMQVIGEAATAAQALAVVRRHRPDVAVLDVRLDDGSGIEVCRDIREQFPDVRCLMLTSYADDAALVEAALAGASGFVLKRVRGNELIESIRKVADGAQLLDAAAVRIGRRRFHATDEGRVSTLTPQEHRIFDLIGEGYSNRQIADEMCLAEKTVKNYVSNMLTKLGMDRRTQAAAFSARLDERRKRWNE